MKIDSPNILNQLTISGSVEISGSLTISGSVLATTYVGVLSSSETGSLITSASVSNSTIVFTRGDGSTLNVTIDDVTNAFSASYIDFSNIDNLPGLVSGSSQISYSGITGVPAGIVSSSAQVQLGSITGTTFASSTFTFPQDLTVQGKLTAQEFNTELISSSIIYESGSTKFGDTLDDTHSFTGSIEVLGAITGSLKATNGVVSGSSQISYTGITNVPAGIVSGSAQVKSLLPAGTVSGSAQVAINSTTGTLDVNKGGTGQTSYTNGQLLIGNTTGNTLTKATLTAGTGISVTNGAGSISIAATNNGTVTSIATGDGITGGTITTTGTLGLTGQALALHNLGTNGVIARTGAGTVAGRTITGTTNQVTVTNGDGVSGNPTLSLPQSINTAASVQFGSFGVGTTASGVTGEIRATNEVTAFFSDDRLKNRIDKIGNALEKVNQLNGYYFVENDLAKSLGYTNDKVQVGVSAQEVQAVLPEVVTTAPIDDQYLTVKYDKLVPLLIEAIKEQDVVIKQLISDIDSLKNKLNDRGN